MWGREPGGLLVPPQDPASGRSFHAGPASAVAGSWRLSFLRGGPPISYGSRLWSMCQMIVANRRITATRAIFEPGRCLIRLYHARITESFRSTCITS